MLTSVFFVSRVFHQQILIRLETGEDRGAGAWGHKFFLVLITKNLKQLDTAGTEMRAPVYGVRDVALTFLDEELRFYEIGMVCRV